MTAFELDGAVAVVTGGAGGIGEALATRLAAEGARVAVVDLRAGPAQEVAARIPGAIGLAADVGDAGSVNEMVAAVEAALGPIDLYCSNAGIGTGPGLGDDAVWDLGWRVHTMAHVYAARACLPHMIARGEGYFMNTASAAGLLNQIGNAVYGVTKHAAVGFAEILAITHRDQGIRVSVLCPQAVDTPLLRRAGEGSQNVDGVLTPEQVAEVVVEAIEQERFEILPHPQVLGYMRKKTEDYSRWIGGMAKLQRTLNPSAH